VAEAVQVAWGLITTIPPRIATCEPKDHFDEDLHELVGTGIPPEDGKYKLIYSRPVLFTSCVRKDVKAGRVRVVQSDDATTKGDSLSDRSTSSNFSGPKISRNKGEYQGVCIGMGQVSTFHIL